jgi:putative ABC transport system substrate-binding protein
LKETGFVEGRNVVIEYFFTDGRNDRLPMLAAELVRRHVAVLMANATAAALAAKAATATIPIVFVTGGDPVELRLVASFNRPSTNATGVTILVNKLVAKRLELMGEIAPRTAPFAMLVDSSNPNAETDVRDAVAAAATLGRMLLVAKVATSNELDAAFADFVRQRVGALFVTPSVNFRGWRHQLAALSVHHALPASYSDRDFVAAGGLMSYGPDQSDLYHQVGIYAGRILKGEKPAELPVVQPTKFELVINAQTARMLGLTVPPTLIATADEVIE